MQTKRKRKQWVLIALTMIATLTLQLFVPITACAEETKRTLEAQYSVTLPKIQGTSKVFEMMYRYNVTLSGAGNFVVHSAKKSYLDESSGCYTRIAFIYICSDKSFTANLNESTYSDGKSSSSSEYELNVVTINDIYVATIGVTLGKGLISDIYLNAPNQHTIPSDYDGSYIDELIAVGAIDLSKDDYKELVFDESTATYDVNLDFASLGAESNSAWTVSKGDDGYTLTTPSTAGVNIYWKNKQYVENSYVKIYFNGKYYKKFLDIKYVDGAISLSGEGASSSVEYDKIDRSSNSVFFLYNDILSECIKQNNYDGGYSFVIDNIQLQCYAEIDGIVKKSRIYKIDFDLLRENGTTDTVFNDASNVTYSTTDSVLGDFTTAYDDLEFVADIDADKPIYEYDEVEINSFIKFFKWFYEMLQGITNSLGQFPQLLTSVFGFLPKEVTIIIGLALGAAVILRFLGR